MKTPGGSGPRHRVSASQRVIARRLWRHPVALPGASVAVIAALVLAVLSGFGFDGLASQGSQGSERASGDLPAASASAGTARSGRQTPGSSAPAGIGRLGARDARPTARPSPAKGPDGSSPLSRWPGPDNTGVPTGTRLSAYTGSLTITKANTTIDAKTINGCLEVRARNVTIKRSKITCGGAMIIRVRGSATVTVVDSELDGRGAALAIGYGNYTLRRTEIRNINEGPRVSSNTVIEDSWIHGLVRRPGDHHDILQTTGGVKMVVRHNLLEAYDPRTDDLFNAAFMVGAETSPLDNLLVEDNLMTGGNYTVNIRNDPRISSVVFRNNTFVRNARYGPVIGQGTPGVSWESNNVFQDTGKPVA